MLRDVGLIKNGMENNVFVKLEMLKITVFVSPVLLDLQQTLSELSAFAKIRNITLISINSIAMLVQLILLQTQTIQILFVFQVIKEMV